MGVASLTVLGNKISQQTFCSPDLCPLSALSWAIVSVLWVQECYYRYISWGWPSHGHLFSSFWLVAVVFCNGFHLFQGEVCTDFFNSTLLFQFRLHVPSTKPAIIPFLKSCNHISTTYFWYMFTMFIWIFCGSYYWNNDCIRFFPPRVWVLLIYYQAPFNFFHTMYFGHILSLLSTLPRYQPHPCFPTQSCVLSLYTEKCFFDGGRVWGCGTFKK